MCVCCCVFLYNTTIMITSAVITDKDTNRIRNITMMRIIIIVVARGSVVVGSGRV